MININELLYKISVIITYLEYNGGHKYKIYNHLCPDNNSEPDSDIVEYAKDVELLIIELLDYYNDIIC